MLRYLIIGIVIAFLFSGCLPEKTVQNPAATPIEAKLLVPTEDWIQAHGSTLQSRIIFNLAVLNRVNINQMTKIKELNLRLGYLENVLNLRDPNSP